jgi:hypothetical protein
MQENTCNHIHLLSISEPANPVIESNSLVEQTSDFDYKCPYCSIAGYGTAFGNTDLLVKHVVHRHPGCTAHPRQPDMEKYMRGLKEKGRSTDG